MSSNPIEHSLLHPTSLQEAINIIRFLMTTNKEEVSKLKEENHRQAEFIKKLKINRKEELEFLTKEIRNYEIDLSSRTDAITKQLHEKDEIIQKQADIIEKLNNKIKPDEHFPIPEIKIHPPIDSNSDSGVAMENDDTLKLEDSKVSRKCSKKFSNSISFFRKVDFSPIKYKPSNNDHDGTKKNSRYIKNTLEVPIRKIFLRRPNSNERSVSDEDMSYSIDTIFSDSMDEPIFLRSKKMNDSMNNHFSDDESDDTSEDVFDRVMIKSSVRRSVKANPKYKKINRTKSKLLEQLKDNIVD